MKRWQFGAAQFEPSQHASVGTEIPQTGQAALRESLRASVRHHSRRSEMDASLVAIGLRGSYHELPARVRSTRTISGTVGGGSMSRLWMLSLVLTLPPRPIAGGAAGQEPTYQGRTLATWVGQLKSPE